MNYVFGDLAFHKFCGACGGRLVFQEYVHGFDEETGHPVMYTKLRCRKYRSWSRRHFNEIFDETGKIVRLHWSEEY